MVFFRLIFFSNFSRFQVLDESMMNTFFASLNLYILQLRATLLSVNFIRVKLVFSRNAKV